jgi:hypothetical protein
MLKVGKTYKTKTGREYECILVRDNRAWMTFHPDSPAYLWNSETGESLSLNSDYDIKKPPREFWIDPETLETITYPINGYIHVKEADK